jgi:voltage-gated potassium channel Kch
MKRVLFVLFSVGLVAHFGGCSPVKDKAHDLGNAFSGNYDSTVAATPNDVIAAARAAVPDLHLILISEQKQAGDATAIVIARSAEDEKVTVTVLPQGPDSTRFTVTTGVFGNSTLRQQVMDAIKLHLGSVVIRPATQPATHP